jgi:hypothetical protein
MSEAFIPPAPATPLRRLPSEHQLAHLAQLKGELEGTRRQSRGGIVSASSSASP